jgi:hypothetical protein
MYLGAYPDMMVHAMPASPPPNTVSERHFVAGRAGNDAKGDRIDRRMAASPKTENGSRLSTSLTRWLKDRHVLLSNPLVWAGASVVMTVGPLALMAPREMPAQPVLLHWTINFVLAGCALASPMVAMWLVLLFYPSREGIVERVISSYFAMLLAFANVYFVLAVVRPGMFEGMHEIWQQGPWGGRVALRRDVLLAYVDCFHHSVQTITTVGFGNISPTHWVSKLLTDAEVLLGLGISGIGLARALAQPGEPRG